MFTELEYKYNADDIRLSDFRKFVAKAGAQKNIEVASWDFYFTKPTETDSFHRLRLGPTPELTKKIKLSSTNNYQRVEVDLPLDPSRLTVETVAKYMELQGYQENFRIFKYCDIYVLHDVNYVYYTVYGDNLQEFGRFIEIEVNKERVTGLNQGNPEGAVNMLNHWARYMGTELGVTPQNRMRKSLFELYRTDK